MRHLRPMLPGVLALALFGCADDAGWIASIALDPEQPTTVDDLRCVVAIGDDRVNLAFAWEVDGERVQGAESETLTSDAFVRGQQVTCVARPSVGSRAGSVSTATTTVVNAAPVGLSAQVEPQQPTAATELSCVALGEDADGDPLTWAIAWEIDGAAAGTSATLPAGSIRRLESVRCVATPNDGTTDGAPVASAERVAGNAPPIVESLLLEPAEPRATDTLFASAVAVDPDGDLVTLTYAWRVDGELVASGTSPSLAPGAFRKHDEVSVVVTARDPDAAGAPRDAAVTILNTAPTAPEARVSPAIGLEQRDDLICEIATPSADADGDSLTYRFAWEVDGLPYEGAVETSWPGDTIPAELTWEGQEWACEASADDGEALSAPGAAVAVVTSWAGPRVFTTCGRQGSGGPTSGLCADAYASGTLAGEVTVEAGVQQWTVPSDGLYRIRAAGAQGSDTSRYASGDGGRGAVIEATLELSEGDRLRILVGQAGQNSSGGWNATTPGFGAPGGGGGTFVARGDDPLVVAGGGGGGGTVWDDAQHGATGPDGRQGNPVGGSAPTDCYAWTVDGGGARGGTGGTGGCTNVGFGGGGWTGSGDSSSGGRAFLSGGAGGVNGSYLGGFGGGGAGNWNNYGGGGGGYSGGGGGNNNERAGGGGGGSYVAPGARDVATSDGRYAGATTFEGEPIEDLDERRSDQGEVTIDRVFE